MRGDSKVIVLASTLLRRCCARPGPHTRSRLLLVQGTQDRRHFRGMLMTSEAETARRAGPSSRRRKRTRCYTLRYSSERKVHPIGSAC